MLLLQHSARSISIGFATVFVLIACPVTFIRIQASPATATVSSVNHSNDRESDKLLAMPEMMMMMTGIRTSTNSIAISNK